MSAGTGVELEVPDIDQQNPYVLIDIDEPNTELSTVKLSEIKLVGNVARVTISIKEVDDREDWASKNLNVDEDGNIKVPSMWRVAAYNFIPVGMIKFTPLTTRNGQDTTFIFKVYLYGCPLCMFSI